VINVYKCPKCHQENNAIIKEWDYGPLKNPAAKVHVERYRCKKCGVTYRAWIGRKKVKVVKE
jgi:rubredoxin